MNLEFLTSEGGLAMLAVRLGVIVLAAKLGGAAAGRMQLPPVLGELIAGLLLGPGLLGGIGFDVSGFEHGLFPVPDHSFAPGGPGVYAVAVLGSVLLLFTTGLETKLRMFFRYSAVSVAVGIGGGICAFGTGVLFGMAALEAPFYDPRCLFLGLIAVPTSVGVAARILSEHKKVDSPEGVTILGAAVIDDVLGVGLLTLVMGLLSADWGGFGDGGAAKFGRIALFSVGLWVGVTLTGLLFAHRIAAILKKLRTPAAFAIAAFGGALLLAGLFQQAGLALIVGAYTVGLVLSRTDLAFSIHDALKPLNNLLVPVFFAVMGMMVDLRLLTDPAVLKLGLAFSVAAVLAKILGGMIPALCTNFNLLGSLRIGVGMMPRAELSLIVAGIGFSTLNVTNSSTVLSRELFAAAVLLVLISALFSSPLLALLLESSRDGVRKQLRSVGTAETLFRFATPELTEFVLKGVIVSFAREGFQHSTLDKESGVIQLRRGRRMLFLTVGELSFRFESSPGEVRFIREVMYETSVELHHSLDKLKALSQPDELRRELFPAGIPVPAPAPEASSAKTRMVDPARILNPACVVMELTATDCTGVFRELVMSLDRTHHLANRELALADTIDREQLVSTCIQNGIGLPHARTRGVESLVAAIGIRRDGYDFGSLDGLKTRIFVLCLCPAGGTAPYLQFISQIAARLNDEAVRERVLNAAFPEEVFRAVSGLHGANEQKE